jgi:hypothetical protein
MGRKPTRTSLPTLETRLTSLTELLAADATRNPLAGRRESSMAFARRRGETRDASENVGKAPASRAGDAPPAGAVAWAPAVL